MTHNRPLVLIGAASGLGMPESQCATAPAFLRKHLDASAALSGRYEWHDTLRAPPAQPDGPFPPPGLADFSRRLAGAVSACVIGHERFLVLGGDHSTAIGTWAGASQGLRDRGELGLVWIDAHMDAHTSQSTPSGRVHGMPLANLLGHGDPQLDFFGHGYASLRPENLCLVGVHSYEPEEADLLRRLGVRICFMPELRQRGLTAVLGEAVALASASTAGFGISLDLDAFDPAEAPAVTTPVRRGIASAELLPALREACAQQRFIGMDIVEFNPPADREGRTARLVEEVVKIAAEPIPQNSL